MHEHMNVKENLSLCCYTICTVISLLIYSVMSSITFCVFMRLHVLSMHVRRDKLSVGLSEVMFLAVTRERVCRAELAVLC
jgi:hypothetical protein